MTEKQIWIDHAIYYMENFTINHNSSFESLEEVKKAKQKSENEQIVVLMIALHALQSIKEMYNLPIDDELIYLQLDAMNLLNNI